MDTFKKKKKKEQYSIDTLLTGNRERSASVFDEEERKRRIQRVKERTAQTREAIDDVRERYSSRVSMDGSRSAGITDEERQRRIDRVKSVSANTGSFVTPGTRRDTESSDGGLFSRRNGDFGGFSISSLLSSIADRGADNQLKVENNDSERQRRLERTKQYKTPQEKKEEERAAADSVPVTTTENTEKTKAVKDTEKDNKDTTPSQTLPTPKAGTAPTVVPPSESAGNVTATTKNTLNRSDLEDLVEKDMKTNPAWSADDKKSAALAPEPTQTPQAARTPAPAASDLPMGVNPKVVASSGAIPVEQSQEVPYLEKPITQKEADAIDALTSEDIAKYTDGRERQQMGADENSKYEIGRIILRRKREAAEETGKSFIEKNPMEGSELGTISDEKINKYDGAPQEEKSYYVSVYNTLTPTQKSLLNYIQDEKDSFDYMAIANIAAGFSGQTGGASAGQYSASIGKANEARRILKEEYGMTDEEIDACRILQKRSRDAEIAEKDTKNFQTITENHPWLMSAASVPMSVLGTPGAALGKIRDYEDIKAAETYGMGDIGYDPNNVYGSLRRDSQIIRQTFTDNHDLLIGDYDIGDMLYNTAMSGAESVLVSYMPGGAVLLGAGAAVDTMQEMSDRGIDSDRALIGGLFAGGAEALFEKFSIGNFKKMQSVTPKSVKDVLLNVAKSAGVNASEEMLTEASNILYDSISNGDMSNFAIAVRKYQDEGMSLDKAKKQAAKDLAWQITESGISGALMGFGTGAIATSAGKVRNDVGEYYIGRYLKERGLQDEIIASGLAAPEGSRSNILAGKYKNKGAEKVSNRALAKLERENSEYINQSDEVSTGRFEKAETVSELNRQYETTIEQLKKIGNPGKGIVAAIEADYQASLKALTETESHRRYVKKMQDAATAVSEAKLFEIKHPDIKTDSGTATVNKIVDIKDGKFTVETTEKTGRRTEVITPDSVVDQTARELMEVAKDMTVETAQKFMEGYKGGEVNRYKESWDYYSNMGRANVDFEKAQRLDGVYYNYISAEAAQAAIKSGFNDREFTVGVTDLSTTKKTYQERMMFRVMEGFAKEFGTEFIVVDDLDNANGYFIGDTNRIVISRNAEGGMLLRTAGHEAYHFIESNSAESAQALGDFVIDSLKKNGMDIEAQAAKLRRRYSADGAVSDAQIRAEIVADSMFEVLNSKEAINRFVRKNNPKKVQSVIDAIEKIVNSIKTSLVRMGQKLDGSGKYVHPEIKALVDDYEALEEIRKQFMKGMESASASFAESKNKKSAEKAADKSSGIKFSKKANYPYNMQTVIKDYIDSVDPELLKFVQKYYSDSKAPFDRKKISTLNEKQISDMQKLVGVDYSGYENAINKNGVRHIVERHGENGAADNSMANANDLARIGYVIENYDTMEAIRDVNGDYDLSTGYMDKNNVPAKMIRLTKQINGTYYVVETIPENKYKKIWVVSAYIQKNGAVTQAPVAKTTGRTSKTSLASPDSNISISKESEKVNTKKSLKAEDDAPTAIDRYYAEAIRENRAFSQIFALMGDMYSTKMGEVYLDNADIRALSKKLLKEFGSKYDEAALTDELQIVFDYMANNRGNIDVDGCMKIFMQSAQNILENSEMKNDELWQHHADTREFLREQNIYITPELKAEIEAAYGDYKSFRSRLMGKMMHISTKDSGAATLDEVWGELNERAPEYFPKDVTDKDQPLYLTKFFESIAPKTVNRVDHYSLDMETESAILAARMFEEFGNIGRLKTTEQKIADLYRTKQFKLKRETQALRRKLKADAEKHKADTVEDYRKQLGDYRTAREMTEKRRRLRNEIDRSVAYVNRRLERETDKDHIPEKLKPLTRSFLRALPDNGEYFNPDRFASFVQEYDKLKSDFAEDDFEYMKARMNEFSDNVAGRSEAQPPKRRELDDVQLATLRDIAAHVKYIVQNENRMFNENIKETAQQLSQKAHSELTAKGKSSVQGVPEHASKLSKEAIRNRFDSFARRLVKPDYLFANLGSDTLEMLYKEMHKGENVETEMIRQAKTDLDEIRRRNNYDTRWKYQTVTVKSRDGELTITVEDAMALYATCKRNQGLGHILNGGFEIEFKTKKGWVKDRRVFTPDDIRLLKDSLSKDQLNYMNETVEYITKVIGEKRNETSMRMLGIKKYNEEFYFPIKTHENFNDTSVGVKKGVAKIENQSSAKRTTKNADNPVVIRGFSDTVVDHVFDSAMYCAYAAAIKDFARVYNYRERNEAEGLEIYTDSRYSIKEDVQRANGVNAIKEVEAFLQALDSGSMDKSALSLSAKFASKAKKAAVMANVSVVVQQPTSVFRAMLHVSPKYFATFATKADIEEMKKYNPGCTFKKEIGYFDINVGSTATDYMKEHTVDKAVKKDWGARDRARNLAEKALPKIDEVSGWAASKADEMTWGAIWNACKKQTAAQNSDLSPEQVKSKAAELFQEVISKTQVYDSVFTKNAAMRSKSGFDTMIMQFMSEPMTTLNMLADAVVNAKNGRQPKSRCAAAFACYITSLVANSAVKSLVYSLRDDDEEKSFVEKFIGNFAEGAITDPFGMIPYLKEVLSLVQGYDFERIDTKALEELLNAYQSVINDDKTPWDKVMAVMKAVGYATGVPFHTVMRDGKAVVEAGKKVYDAVANGKALEPTTGEGIKQTLAETFDWVPGVNPANKYEQLYNALIEGDTAHYNKVYNNLIEDGKEENTINNELSKRLVKDGRIAEIYNKMLNGEAAEAAEVIGKLKDQGFNQETIDKALSKHENSIKDEIVADSRAQEAAVAKSNMDYDSYEKLISDMVDDGYPEALVIKAVKSLAPKDEEYDEFSPSETDPLYSDEDLEIALASGNMKNVEAVYSEYEAAHGAEKAAETMRKATRAAYKSGLISDSQAEAYLRKYKTEDTDDNDIFWAMEELRGGDGYKKYNKLCKAIESGASVEDVLDYYTEHGVEMKTVKSNITTNFKPKLIEAQGTEEFDELYDNVIDAFVATGDSEIEAKKKVNKWFEN